MMKYILVSIAFLSTILFAEKVSFKEIENVAINYYRQNIAYNQFVNGIITDYEKAINPDSIDFDLDSLVFKNLTVSYIFNINPTGYIQVRAVNALPPIASWSEKCFKEIDNSPPKTPEPGELTIKPRNSTYNHYYAKPIKWSLEVWNKYKVDPKYFHLKKKYKAKQAGLGESTNIAINYFRNQLATWIVGDNSSREYIEAIMLENIKFELDSLVYDNIVLCYYYNFFPTGHVTILPYYNQAPIHMVSVEDHFNPTNEENNDKMSNHISYQKINYDRSIYCLPFPKATWQWNKYNIDPKDFKIVD